jgi:hypothetical protein
MSTLQQQYALAQNATVQQVIRMSMIGNALTIVSEATDSSHPVKHQKRHDLAMRVLNDPDYYQPRFVQAAAAQDILTTGSSDSQINAAIALLFDKISGVDAND